MSNSHRTSNEERLQRMKLAVARVPVTSVPITIGVKEGLTLQELERRWAVSAPIARDELFRAGVPWGGRKAGLIYSWPTIFMIEGVPDDLARRATRGANPELFADLRCTKGAAAFFAERLGQYRDSSSVRKLVAAGTIPTTAYITLGRRSMYRFRPAALETVCRRLMKGRIV